MPAHTADEVVQLLRKAIDNVPFGRARGLAKGRRATMSEKSRYVVAAADEWLTAITAITAADEAQRRTVAQQDDLDAAEVALAAAVMNWRDAGRPI
jgi:hypothetical protein